MSSTSFVKRFGIVSLLEVFGVLKPSRGTIDFEGQVTFTDDPTNDRTILTFPGPSPVVHSGLIAGMNDANFAITDSATSIYVGSSAAFTLDRTLTLPAAPSAGEVVTWADECATAGGSLVTHNLVINGNGKSIQAGGTGFTGGIVSAATYTATSAAWPPGSSISLMYNGTFWKVL